MRTIAIANQKGGCGKTTTAVNLAGALAILGSRTLLVDLDPQAHSTLAFGFGPENLDKTIYHAITKTDLPVCRSQIPISKAVLRTSIETLNLVPSNILLSGIEFELAKLPGREYVLTQQLSSLAGDYDLCVIDCSPSLSLLTLNALVAASDIVVPVQTQYYALEGLKQLLETIDIVRERFNPNLAGFGILLTFVEKRIALSRQVQRQMREFFGNLVFDTVIHRTTRLAEAPSAGESVLTYDPKSKGALEYTALAREIIAKKIAGRAAVPLQFAHTQTIATCAAQPALAGP
ncbi:MAG TPA: AAA family ATPase [Sedimentisphaerales bacterium]|nr:AAA family ATPase [Sedimentisphaerales bacterium]